MNIPNNFRRLKTLNKILDIIEKSNGVSIQEIADTLKMSWFNTKNACKILLKENCISEGAIQKFNKAGTISDKLGKGFFYESNLPTELNLYRWEY